MSIPGQVATLRILACRSANRKLAPGRLVGFPDKLPLAQLLPSGLGAPIELIRAQCWQYFPMRTSDRRTTRQT
jgi:hypothetical protein